MAKSVLIVDDLSFMRNALKEILTSSGFKVSGEAENGKQGVELYLDLHPDVVLLDITMPVMNGLVALREIMKREPSAKVIMCSALGQEEYIMKAIQLGARDFIVKPFKPERITSAVAR
ncbi:MAG: response regulator, partial [Gammaproteobacteria bacterium]|nr:response regulator [Gammaproteobacteria bacterium]NIR95761.1 response regulator [Gammaproteobacteria bacterium]NIW42448.1 response regulator [candidate division Zixibacteria bacterium]NIX59760.1 response regulator [candidate division Zixibacteria bacterium]